MVSATRACRPLNRLTAILRQPSLQSRWPLPTANTLRTTTSHRVFPYTTSQFHTTASRRADEEPSRADLSDLDVLGNTPVPSTSVDVCTSNGFHLNSGARVTDGSGVLLINGEAFTWRPWAPRGEKRLLNKKGQWEVPNETFGLFGLLWPRPDLLILGLGPDIRPMSPELRRHISSLGMRVEILDTRNAAAQYNLLATERGVKDVAAALIPIGWREGVGAA
ncbi:hypothetical protein F4815DRAFT_451173 [Daldinia loculata]|uniref:uncharacterized protein n=1 Tax=Daldinia loculata TaxID=103429 RepID=UPI0020C3D43F|nr:uncharacterized protein F4817DRAFT_336900 [Daldinia loculata]KAI1647512.1 hypothetical protein F4817DRAFT_336900 [Daldinia loculata]KAI2785039.1 hypothetical protein F4815DRAFT_451173 [Daldinia loculata]